MPFGVGAILGGLLGAAAGSGFSCRMLESCQRQVCLQNRYKYDIIGHGDPPLTPRPKWDD